MTNAAVARFWLSVLSTRYRYPQPGILLAHDTPNRFKSPKTDLGTERFQKQPGWHPAAISPHISAFLCKQTQVSRSAICDALVCVCPGRVFIAALLGCSRSFRSHFPALSTVALLQAPLSVFCARAGARSHFLTGCASAYSVYLNSKAGCLFRRARAKQ